MVIHKILTAREREIINKKFKGISLTQNESNILSRYIRPKLREMAEINSPEILNKLNYNQRAKLIERKINKIVLDNIKNVNAIILYGSAVQTNYANYNDIDVIIIVNKRLWSSRGAKYDIIIKLTEIAEKSGLNLDVQMVDKKSFVAQYPYNPSLIYQLKDSKIIYGSIKLPSKVKLSKLDLRMKLDWSELIDNPEGKELYQSLRNIILVRLLAKGIVDNNDLRISVANELGKDIISRLKSNTASKLEKKMVLQYIKELLDRTDREIMESKWERIKLQKH